MRLLLVNELAGCVGGAEVHLRQLIPGLRARGHEVAFLHGQPAPEDGRLVPVAPPDVPAWCAATSPSSTVLEAIRAWTPDLVYAHRLIAPEVLGPLVDRRPSVFFIHGYFGVCISGARCQKAPVPRPCDRTFGWGCLIRYLPRRCGGWNPLTMARDFARERRHQAFLRRFDLLLTHSEHVRDEYIRHGHAADRTRCVPFFVEGGTGAGGGAGSPVPTPGPVSEPDIVRARVAEAVGRGPLRLLFIGRFDVLKGGAVLVQALPGIRRRLGRPVTLVLVGDGPERGRWEALARVVMEAGGAGCGWSLPGGRPGERRRRRWRGRICWWCRASGRSRSA